MKKKYIIVGINTTGVPKADLSHLTEIKILKESDTTFCDEDLEDVINDEKNINYEYFEIRQVWTR